jgi:hypothetical protein
MSRPLRGQERGYRRLTVGVSLVLLCVGLALTARDSYRVVELYSAQTREETCRRYSTESKQLECERVSIDEYLSRPFSFVFDAITTFTVATFHRESTFFVDLLGFAAGHILAFTVCLGIVVSLILAAVPWVVFYSVRWIARGFAGAV